MGLPTRFRSYPRLLASAASRLCFCDLVTDKLATLLVKIQLDNRGQAPGQCAHTAGKAGEREGAAL